MTNPPGTPIWYELGATDPDAAKAFYQAVAPWTVEAQPAGEMDYRMIDTGDGFVGGLARHDPAQAPSAALKPGWRVYFGVDDVDATVAAITEAGGAVHFGPFDLEGVGRMAFVADPQGNPFYVMRGATEGATSTVFSRTGFGKAAWHELITSDAAASNAFYAQVFGWTYPGKMEMGEMGDYTFIDCAGQQLGGTMKGQPGQPSGWQVYFRVADVDAAAEAVKAGGGAVFMGPMEVPGGERVIFGCDPAQAPVGFVSGEAR